jgi:hypothetical protein
MLDGLVSSHPNWWPLLYLFFQGIAGFWRGVTASYWGISETVIHFVVYEYLKSQLAAYQVPGLLNCFSSLTNKLERLLSGKCIFNPVSCSLEQSPNP